MPLDDNHPLHITYKWARRIVVAVVGFTILLAGLAMTVLPGPAFVVIPLGLAVLSLEFAWARRWLRKVKRKSRQLTAALTNGRNANGRNARSSGRPR